MRCAHRAELELSIRAGHWPAAVPEELRGHVALCGACREYAQVSMALLRLRASGATEACLPGPGLVWWRAQLRKRRETMDALERPLQRAQLFAVALCLIAAVAAAFWVLRSGVHWSGAAWSALLAWPTLAGLGVLLLAMAGVLWRVARERD